MTHPSKMLLDALCNDVRITIVILRDHGKSLNDRFRVQRRVRWPRCIVAAERVDIEVEDRSGDGRWRGRVVRVGGTTADP